MNHSRSGGRARRSRLIGGLAFVASVALLLAACSSGATTPKATSTGSNPLEARDSKHLPADWDKVVAAANKEGSVVIYTNLTAVQVAPINAAFNAAYPDIKVQMVNDSVATLPTRFSQERTSTGKSAADVLESSLFESVITANPSWFIDLKKESKGFLPSLNDFESVAVPKDRPHSVTSAAYTWQLVYNTNLVKSKSVLPKSWKDAADSKWAGKTVMADPRAAATYLAFYRLLREKLGDSYLKDLAANKPSLSQAAADVAQKVASGAFAIGFPVNKSTVSALVTANAPIGLLPLAPSEVGATTTAFPTKAPHPNAARVYGNFILSAEGQELMCQATSLASLNTLAKGSCAANQIPADLPEMNLTTSPTDKTAIMDDLGLN